MAYILRCEGLPILAEVVSNVLDGVFVHSELHTPALGSEEIEVHSQVLMLLRSVDSLFAIDPFGPLDHRGLHAIMCVHKAFFIFCQ